MTLTQPHETCSINGFPLTFRAIQLPDGQTVWVPRGISRNDVSGCWRIYLVSEQGLFTRSVADNEHEHSALASLEAAFVDMKAFLQGATSRFVVDRRARPEGVERDPLVDCGVTGVVISRSTRKDYKTVVITANITVQKPDGELTATNFYSGSISERSEETDPRSQQQTFRDLVKRAIEVRRYYNQLRSQGLYPAEIIRHEDVPEDILNQPVELPEHLDINEIMDSFVAGPWEPVVRTTGGDPAKLAASLQCHDLAKPHKLVYLNGFSLRFRRMEVEGKTLYLPKELYRARGQWRIRIFHADGIYEDSISDDEYWGDSDKALAEAWAYLISEIRQLEAPEAENRRPAKNPLLETGIRAVNITGYSRASKITGHPRWSFSLGFQQDEGSGYQRRTVVATWPLSTVTDEQILVGLRHAAAMSAYHQHLLEAGASPAEAALRRDSQIPAEFWPADPPCPLSVDDLRYFAEQREINSKS